MSIIVSNCQHCDKQQFQTLLCLHYTIFSVVKLDLYIRALLLDCILALEKTTRTLRVHLVIIIPQCMKQYIEVCVSEGNVLSIMCPDAQCEKQGELQNMEVGLIPGGGGGGVL